jgi:ABC-type Fe3+/spermidine/putrescine transport system ATPase subunit
MMAAFARSTPSAWRSGVANFFSLLGPSGCGKTTPATASKSFVQPRYSTRRPPQQDCEASATNRRMVGPQRQMVYRRRRGRAV